MARIVLVADDSPTIQKRAQGILKGEGFAVETVSNGVAAIKKLALVDPLLVLADVSMPGRDGYEVCEFVKSSKEHCHVPVLLVASDLEPYDAERGARVRADGKIKKPFEPQELISVVARFAAQAEALSPAAVPAEASTVGAPSVSEPTYPEFSAADELAEEGSPQGIHELPHFTEGIAFAAPSDEMYAGSPEPPPAFQSENLPEQPAAEISAGPDGGGAFEPWVGGTAPAVPEPSIMPESAEESEPPETPPSSEGGATVVDVPTPVAPELEAATASRPAEEPEEVPEQVAEAPIALGHGLDQSHTDSEQKTQVEAAELLAPIQEPSDSSSEPVYVEEAEQTPSETAEPSAPERPMIFRAPAQIAEPVLSDELAPPAGELEPPPVPAISPDGSSLADAGSGQAQLTREQPEAPPDGSAPAGPAAEAVPRVSEIDWGLVYSIVHKVVLKMSTSDTPAERIEEAARNLTKDIVAELNAKWAEPHT